MKTVKDVFAVYGNKYPPIPQGYQAKDFRDPRPGEYFVSEFPQYQSAPVLSRFPWKEQHGPRLILQKAFQHHLTEIGVWDNWPIPLDKVEKTYGRAYNSNMIPPWYEYAGFGVPAKGQKFLPVWGAMKTPPAMDICRFSNFRHERILLKKKQLQPVAIPTVKDVYGTNTPEIPKGYVATRFRPIRKGDIWLNSMGNGTVGPSDHDDPNSYRIILRPIVPSPTPKPEKSSAWSECWSMSGRRAGSIRPS